MKINNQHYRTIWVEPETGTVELIDQRWLPHEFQVETISSYSEMATAIREMHIRGAGAIGAAAGFGMYLAARNAVASSFDETITHAAAQLRASRPTAVNLDWAVTRQLDVMSETSSIEEKTASALRCAREIADEDVWACQQIGEHGLRLIQDIQKTTGKKRINILTHCNAGWLAFVDHGTATAPIYAAHDAGIDVHVWVDETRPRNQGARLTAWELGQHGVPHTIIADNTGGHLMQHGMVDMVLVGSDRTSVTGYVTNKIGTYLKALAAADNDIPFYVALPSSTFDWTIRDGITETPIEERDPEEVKNVQGLVDGNIKSVLIGPESSDAVNFGFDVTPPRLITALITERGVMAADEMEILKLYPEKS